MVHDKEALDGIQLAVQTALQEDIGQGDVTASIFNTGKMARATVICREDAVLCGQYWFNETLRQLDADIHITWQSQDGSLIEKDSTVCAMEGSAQAMLSAERTALNFLQTLSATATCTRKFVDRISGTSAQILDTRKTLPGMRYAQKYAVKCGSGMNHRMGLYDAVLIKENHIAAAGSIRKAAGLAKKKFPELTIEIEVENCQQLEQALETEADIILLDNFSMSELQTAVRLNGDRKKLEASGNINLDNIREVAKTGVQYISIGAITKNIQAVDFSMRFD
ncbi:MAG: carboxylating nicotinate-nucleotide diphosphorylase [Gammaproteobacteria bacterium]|nr:carboxylating nicotinate-nucleotide diphosphorylase [Gammaproteobacteria bacterium]